MGWIVINDRGEALKGVKQGLHNVTGRILGPNSTVQHALEEILKNAPQIFFDKTVENIAVSLILFHSNVFLINLWLKNHAQIAYKLLLKSPGLVPIMPKGSMYMMIKIELDKFSEYSSCLEFTEGLIREQSVLIFPGFPCFNFPGFMRIVLTVPEDLIIEACERIQEFCKQHYNQ